jgi:aminobenzoyl-glutamate utilization protein B
MKKSRLVIAASAAAFWIAGVGAQRAADDKPALMERIDARREHYAAVAKEIWGFAEVGYQEQKSSALLQQELKAAGFQVRAGVADMPTAFVATFGSGKPVKRRPARAMRSRRTRPATAAATTCSAPAPSRRRSP